MPKKTKPIPKGYHSVTASLTQTDAGKTIEFCKKAFGAKVLMNMRGPGGKIMHAGPLGAYKTIASESTKRTASATIAAFERMFFGNPLLVLDACFVHRTRAIEAKDGIGSTRSGCSATQSCRTDPNPRPWFVAEAESCSW